MCSITIELSTEIREGDGRQSDVFPPAMTTGQLRLRFISNVADTGVTPVASAVTATTCSNLCLESAPWFSTLTMLAEESE
jgi:hypothetical protein